MGFVYVNLSNSDATAFTLRRTVETRAIVYYFLTLLYVVSTLGATWSNQS